MVEDYGAYATWLNRTPAYPNLPKDTWVRVLPPELGGGTIVGKVARDNGTKDSYAVVIPYGADGALLYVHKADVEPVEQE